MTGEPDPATAVVPTTWRRRVDPRPNLARVAESLPAILQIVVAATAAYAFASVVLGHVVPLITVTVTISSLGLVRDTRPRRVAETLAGMIVGILIAEIIRLVAGTGWWQVGVSLAVALVFARFLSPQPGFAIAAAIQAAIVTVLPGAVPFQRLLDGLIGATMALLVTALIPRTPRSVEVREGHALFAAFDGAAETLAQGLAGGNRVRAQRGLEKARGLHPVVESWRASLEAGREIARISPFLFRQRAEIARHERIFASMDLAARNLRVVARRAAYVVDDRQARPVVATLLTELRRGASLIGESLDDVSIEPAAQDALAAVARRLDPAAILPDASLSDQNLVAALRPLAVDLLTAAGMPGEQARGVVPRI